MLSFSHLDLRSGPGADLLEKVRGLTSPQLVAVAERFVRTARAECLDGVPPLPWTGFD